MYDYNSKFDVEKHKETFVNYCEVVITPDGEIHYAQPSHNRFLERYGADRDGTDVDTFVNKCPAESGTSTTKDGLFLKPSVCPAEQLGTCAATR